MPWSTVLVGVGTPLNFSRVLVSTTATQPWFVVPEGCTQYDPPDCGTSRGRLFYPNNSRTWQKEGVYNLHVEQNLMYDGNGIFGFDTIALGLQGTGAPILEHQIIAGIATKDFYIATWGVRPVPTNISNFNDPIPSWLENLKDRGFVASLSWGYTAGCYSEFIGRSEEDVLEINT